MIEDVATTPRKPLTPTQRLALYERFHGICVLCTRKIEAGERWIDEHLLALGLGGSNDPSNRGIAHVACAAAKTYGPKGDLAMIADAKAKKRKHLGIRKHVGPAAQIRSAPMPTTPRAAARAARVPKASLPPRILFVSAGDGR